MLSKKHYQEIAKIINKVQKFYGYRPCIADISDYLSEYFKQDNPKFDKQRFIDACNRVEEQ